MVKTFFFTQIISLKFQHFVGFFFVTKKTYFPPTRLIRRFDVNKLHVQMALVIRGLCSSSGTVLAIYYGFIVTVLSIFRPNSKIVAVIKSNFRLIFTINERNSWIGVPLRS